jgi:cell division septation protein DedD
MTTIGPAVADNSDDPPKLDADHKKRIPMVWIPVTLGIGLLIGAIYLGGRIVTAHQQTQTVRPTQPVPPQVAQVDSPIPAEPPAQSVTQGIAQPEPEVKVDDSDAPVITPEPGKLYLQVGAFNATATQRFIRNLRNDQQLEAHLAPGPKPGVMRILIGPFDNDAAFKEKKVQIERDGIAAFARRY